MPCHGPTSALNQHSQGNGHCIYNLFFIILLFSYYIFKSNNISCSCLSSSGIHFHFDRIRFPLDGCFSNKTFHIFHNQIFRMLYICFTFTLLLLYHKIKIHMMKVINSSDLTECVPVYLLCYVMLCYVMLCCV